VENGGLSDGIVRRGKQVDRSPVTEMLIFSQAAKLNGAFFFFMVDYQQPEFSLAQ